MAEIPVDIFRGVYESDPNHARLCDLATALLAGGSAIDEAASADRFLYPQFEAGDVPSFRGGTQKRGPDVDISKDGDVLANGKGTSMHDKPGFFGWMNVAYFRVPEGTSYSEDQLTLHRGKKPKPSYISNGYEGTAYHYNICPKNPMTPDALRGALENLARAAVVKACSDGKSVRVLQSDAAAVQ